MKLRKLKAEEIEVRVGSINEKGATLLIYKDARVDMNVLDESGEIWKREHQLIDDKLFCTISIWNEDIKQWVSKQDVGVESQSEATKGEASDSFKRAGFNWGIGRELYSAPFIWIPNTAYEGYVNKKTGKHATYDKFAVTSITYKDNEIESITIKNVKTGKQVYPTGNFTPPKTPKATKPTQDPLAVAKDKLNKAFESFGLNTNEKKKEAIDKVLGKAKIDTVNEAKEVEQALEEGLI